MSIFIDQNSFKPIVETPIGNGDSFRNVQKLTMGSGSSKLEANIADGFWMGAETFALAPVRIAFNGSFLFGDEANNKYLKFDGTDLTMVGIPLTLSNISDAGSLAGLNSVGASNCDSTIISGGKIITGLLTADNITTGTLTGITITGGTIQTGTTGYNLKLTSSLMEFRNGTTGIGSLWGVSGDILALDAGNGMLLTAGDQVVINFNDGGGNDDFAIKNDGTVKFAVLDSGQVQIADDLYVSGIYSDSLIVGDNIQTLGNYYSSDNSPGWNGSRDVVMSVYNGGANYAYRTFTFKDGLLTNIGSEQTTSS